MPTGAKTTHLLASLCTIVLICTPHESFLSHADSVLYGDYSTAYFYVSIFSFSLGIITKAMNPQWPIERKGSLSAAPVACLVLLTSALTCIDYVPLILRLPLFSMSAIVYPIHAAMLLCSYALSGYILASRSTALASPPSFIHKSFSPPLRISHSSCLDVILDIIASSLLFSGWTLMNLAVVFAKPSILTLVLVRLLSGLSLYFGLYWVLNRLSNIGRSWVLPSGLIGSTIAWIILTTYNIPASSRPYDGALFLCAGIITVMLRLLISPRLHKLSGCKAFSTCSKNLSKANPSGQSANIDRMAHSVTSTFPDSKLTNRELDCVAHALGGLSSSESASLLGIQAVTVRTYLSRAYKKLGVSSQAELLTLLSQQKRPAFYQPASPSYATIRSHHVSYSSDVCCLLKVALFTLLFIIPAPWSIMRGWNVSGGIALGSLLAAFSLGILSQQTDGRTYFALITIVVLRFLSSIFIIVYTLYYSMNPALAWSFPILCTLAVSVAFATIVTPSLCNINHLANITFFIIAILVFLAGLSTVAWALLSMVGLLIITGVELKALLSPKAEGAETTSSPKRTHHVFLSFGANLCTGLFLGFCMQEGWHTFSTIGFKLFEIPAFALLLLYPTALYRKKRLGATNSPALSLFGILGVWLIQDPMALIPFVLLLYQNALFPPLESSRGQSHRWYTYVGVALGALLGTALEQFDTFLLSMLADTGIPYPIVEDVGFRSFLFGVLSIALALYVLSNISVVPPLSGAVPTAKKEERLASYLHGRGLTKLQCDVIEHIARGMTGTEIAHALGYSKGAINSARRDAYRKLDIHTSKELLDIIEKYVG